jgi:hypothetical protein
VEDTEKGERRQEPRRGANRHTLYLALTICAVFLFGLMLVNREELWWIVLPLGGTGVLIACYPDVDEFARYLAKRKKYWFPPRRLNGVVLFADGETWILREDCLEEEIAKLFTITGAKKHSREEVLGRYHR